MITHKAALARCLAPALCAVLLPLLTLGGCDAPRKNRGPSVAWDQARLGAMLQLADEQITTGKFQQARDTLAMYNDSTDVRLVCALARVDVEQGNYEAALRRLEPLVSPGQTVPACQRLRGIALEGLGRWQEAALAYELAYASEPAVDLLMAWLDTLILAGQTDAAREVLVRERGRYPGQPAIQVLAAELHARNGRFDDAIGELTTAELAEPGSPEIRRRLAAAYTAVARYRDALVLWRGLLADCRDEHERHALRSRLAACLTATGALDEARALYRVLALAQPEDAAAGTGLAAASLLAGQPDEALEAALNVLQRHPESLDARLLAAVSHRRLNQPEKADALLADVHGSGPDADLAAKLRNAPH